MSTPTTGRTWVIIAPSVDVAALIGAASQIAPQVVALVIGPRDLAERASGFGAIETRWLGETTGSTDPEDFAPAVAKLAEQELPRAVLVASSTRGRLFAGRLAARLDTATITDVTELGSDGDAIIATHPLYGGSATRTEQLVSAIGVVTVSTAAFAALAAEPGSPGPVTDIPCTIDEPRTTVVERRPEPRSPGELGSARVVVGAGRGISQREDLALIDDLAQCLGGQTACTRPLAEGLNWMSHDRYLGVSGLAIAPELYIAVGISGQMQHMVGVDHAGTIVAINSDKAAPVFAEADYGIVGDLHEVLPAIITELKAAP
jgi:electron transfer flavoprotein alpha subunit